MNALHQLTYGLFVLTVKDHTNKNGCIINTVIQLNDDHLLFSLNRRNYTHELLQEADYITIHTIHEDTSKDIFKIFGYQSGRNVNKFIDVHTIESNHYVVLQDNVNNYFNCFITNRITLDTHTIFVCKILHQEVYNDTRSITYSDYQSYLKGNGNTYVCRYCGHVLDVDTVPEDYICPICHHGKEAFEKNLNTKSRSYYDLEKAFEKESAARNKYTYYASNAKKNGYNQIYRVFNEIADNEKEHAKIWLKEMELLSKDTMDNLIDAITGENEEWMHMYKRFEQHALDDNNIDLANKFKMIQDVERSHAFMYETLLNELENQTLFKDDKEVVWRCQNCGYEVQGLEAPDTCPLCNHDKGYFERR